MSNDGLPTYEAVMQHVTSYTSEFAATAQAEKILLQAHVQSIPDINDKMNQNPLDFAFLSKEENEKLTLEIAKLVSSDQGKLIMRTVAHRINKDIKSIRDMFFSLLRRLQEVDAKTQSGVKFHDKFATMQKKFNDTIDNSRTLAQNIASYAEDFEDLIIPLYEDDSITVERKKDVIQDYIDQAEEHSKKSAEQKKEFEDLLSEFNKLVGDFKDFAKVEETSIDTEIKKAEAEISVLQGRIAAAMDKATKSLALGAASGALGTMFLFAVFPLALPLILVGGAVTAGVGGVVAAGFAAYAGSLRTDVYNKQRDIDDKKKEWDNLRNLRHELVKMGEEDFELMRKSLDSIIMVWDSAKRDANEIMEALKKGKKLADLSSGLRIQLNKSVSSYKSVAVYLRAYANTSTGE